ncbi:MAG: ATP-dependent protease LonB [Thermoplasmatota archaeon]
MRTNHDANDTVPVRTLSQADPHAWMEATGLSDTSKIPLPELLIDEVIGQEDAVAVAKKAARQRRHLLLLGDPGTGKSMIAKAMAQILPPAPLDDVLCLPNPKDQNTPRVEVLPGGQGRERAQRMVKKARVRARWQAGLEWGLSGVLVLGGLAAFLFYGGTAGIMVSVLCFIGAVLFLFFARQMGNRPTREVPNLLIERPAGSSQAPYVDATGSHHGALLGDVRHDPFQSGGLQTPTHQRVEPGAIHRAHKGLLYIDEINVLRMESQQALLTAMQDHRYAITGQSERSSGAMTRTEPVPCDFVLVAAGNLDVLAAGSEHRGLHPALRSRIRGYGYEVYVRSVMEDSDENRRKLVRFVAQEVRRDGRIPHFSAAAVAEVLREAQRRSGHTGKLTLRLRELGGLVRTAGDLARDEGAEHVQVAHVLAAKRLSMSLENQITRRGIEVTTAREAIETGGPRVGRAVGAAFLGTGETGEPAGIVVPIESDATPSADRSRGTLFLGGGLDRTNIGDSLGAMVKRLRGQQMAGIDLHVQAILQQVGADVQALGAAAALSALSSLEEIPVRQDTVVVGEVAVGGRLRAAEGVTQMIEAASDLGYTRAIVPAANRNDILLEHVYKGRIEVLFADSLADVAAAALVASPTRGRAIQAALRNRQPPQG